MTSHKVTQMIQHLAAYEWCGHPQLSSSNLFTPGNAIQELHSAFCEQKWRLEELGAGFQPAVLTIAMPQKIWVGETAAGGAELHGSPQNYCPVTVLLLGTGGCWVNTGNWGNVWALACLAPPDRAASPGISGDLVVSLPVCGVLGELCSCICSSKFSCLPPQTEKLPFPLHLTLSATAVLHQGRMRPGETSFCSAPALKLPSHQWSRTMSHA